MASREAGSSARRRLQKRSATPATGIFFSDPMKILAEEHNFAKAWWRNLRAWLYRRLPSGCEIWHLKRRAGFERRWELETDGFTKQGFFQIFQKRILAKIPPGLWVELQAGDGRVGSLGLWLEERIQSGVWKVEAWEHRQAPFDSFQKNRPDTRLHRGRVTFWADPSVSINPTGITTRGVREASGVCRAIRKRWIRPAILGIWNPSRRWIWESRLRMCGYQLEIIYDRMEFYRLVKR